MDSEWQSLTREIIEHPRFQKLKEYQHHGAQNSVFDHSVSVSKNAYLIARSLDLSEQETAEVTRAALLHDFFGYDWHSDLFRRYLHTFSGWQRMMHMHGFVHGRLAATRAERIFHLSPVECDAITRHMFPLCAMPRTKIAWIVTLSDKIVASRELAAVVTGHAAALYRKMTPQGVRES